MNYRHGFHAGNFADVLKHVTLFACLEHLRQKPAPFRVVDTHAGAGHYGLKAGDATRTGEANNGIMRVLAEIAAAPAPVRTAMAGYLELVRRDLGDAGLTAYPGSPAIIASRLRDGDRLIANELHPDDHDRLAAHFRTDRRVKVQALDGWMVVKAALPPPERRGLVLIDPPFEQPGEFHRLTDGLSQGLDRFKTGIYLLWYPIKDIKPVERFRRNIAALVKARGIETTLDLEVLLRAPRHPERLNGCGLIVVNAPYSLSATMGPVLSWLASTVGDQDARGQVTRVET